MDKRTAVKPVPFFLATGFLGSGKTTLLKRLLTTHADHKKIAIIQNEFAEANIDGIELKNTGKKFEILEINKGSVFCVCLLSDFKSSLKELIDRCQPDAVVLEATGLADPIAIGQILMADELVDRVYLAHIWCTADTTTFLRMEAQVTRIAHQVRIADTVILNKTDLATTTTIEEVQTRISRLNPNAEIIQASYCDLPLSDIFNLKLAPEVPEPPRNDFLEIVPGGQPQITSVVLRTTSRITPDNLNTFIQQHEKKAYRIKGYVITTEGTTLSVQSCFGQTTIDTIDNVLGPTELIALGPGIDQRRFSESFKSLAESN